ncbi:methyltransferase domain-containing protein [Reyranella sp.]|uniref:class I SAM-dependent methyltransferase n=1 Tax=Reyranella sp. TaxID=1929291 RepID=UPI003C7A6F52
MTNRPKRENSFERDLVVAAYQVILGRDPESEAVINEKIDHFRTPSELLSDFVNAPESRFKKADFADEVNKGYGRPLNGIEVDVSKEVFDAMFDRVREQWSALGEIDPYWSVLSHDRFRMKSIEGSKEEFYASGASSDRIIDIFAQRCEIVVPQGTCLELGCGVGRITRYLANRFQKVIGVDISEGNLNLARDYLNAEMLSGHVDLMLLRDLRQIEDLSGIDFFYSVIVLQHNPPPLMAEILRVVFGKLRPGGAFLFQVPTHTPGYKFSSKDYLASRDPVGEDFEMHALPMHKILDIIANAGAQPKEVLLDMATGGYGSHTFFGVKN